MDNKNEIYQGRHLVCHSQIGTNNLNNKIYLIFDVQDKCLYWHKVAATTEQRSMVYTKIFWQRFKMVEKMKRIKSLGQSIFYSQGILTKPLAHKDLNVILQIRSPFIKGLSLDEFLRINNSGMNSQAFLKLSFSLTNNLLRFDKKGLIIPSFKTIIVDPLTLNVNMNFFSFIGVNLLNNQEQIQQNELKQILPFLDSTILQQPQKWVNLPRCLAVIMLGIIIGKEVNLIPAKNNRSFRKKQELNMLVKQNPRKFSLILKAQKIKKAIKQYQQKCKIQLTGFLELVLVQEKTISWVQLNDMVFSIKQNNRSQLYYKIQDFLIQKAEKKWVYLKQAQKYQLINNDIVKNQQIKDPFNKQNYQMLLISVLQIDFTLLIDSRSLTRFIVSLQNKSQNSVGTQVQHFINLFYRQFGQQLNKLSSSYNSHMQSMHRMINIHPGFEQEQQDNFPKCYHGASVNTNINKNVQKSIQKSTDENLQQSVQIGYKSLISKEFYDFQCGKDTRDRDIFNNISLFLQPQIYKFTPQGSKQAYKIQNHRLSTLKQYLKCRVED